MTIVTKNKEKRQQPFNQQRLEKFIDEVLKDFDSIPEESKNKYKNKVVKYVAKHDKIRAKQITDKLILEAGDLVSRFEPNWTFVASRFLLKQLYNEAAYNRSYASEQKYGSFQGLLKHLGELDIYSSDILEKYSHKELLEAEKMIDPTKDHLFTYVGMLTLAKRYLVTDHSKRVFELPQERFMIIALITMQNETVNRMEKVKEAYWAMSNHYMTVATPTWANAGRKNSQLSSCFITTPDDSLDSIYHSNTDVAKLSKNAGGIGVYMGKIRAAGSSIRGFKGASSGVLPWMKQLNNTAVSVDQLGVRNGAIAVYLDVWHKDFPKFSEARLNNGDERFKTHDLFLAACVPDLFMEKVEQRGDWYLFDPHEVREVMGWSLEDYYDEKRGEGSFREKYYECVANNNLSKTVIPAIDIMKMIMKSQLETGVMFMFFRDEVNRMNPNKHKGMIYSSNLCVEINQNMSPDVIHEEVSTEDGKIVLTRESGDFVVCNLSSVHLGRAVPANVLERLIPIQVRMLDNVIGINTLPVKQAEITNARYRAIGFGGFSYAHLLALEGLKWGSEEAEEYTDKLYEKIAYLVIKASSDLAAEKGSYPYFEGSDWQTGEYFKLRGYSSEKWQELAKLVSTQGLRNGYLMATAPNASTAILTNGTPTIDPIFSQVYFEEKKDYKAPVVVPDLSPKTAFFYENAYTVNQHDTIKLAARRQKHIDQSQSLNLYVTNDIKASRLLFLLTEAWKSGIKTIYYVRSTSVDLLECDSCAS